MPLAASRCPSRLSVFPSSGMAPRILRIGRRNPISPVEQTSMSRGSQPTASAAAAHIASASARPFSPVPALALPELTTTPAARPADTFSRSKLASTGGARNLFWVKTAAVLDCLEGTIRRHVDDCGDSEIVGLLTGLDGRFVTPGPSGAPTRGRPDVLPTGRNLHGFDPFRLPSAYAVQDGARQAERLLARHQSDGHGFPESIALVLWGTDNMKNEGAPIAQALALLGAKPRFDSYGRLCGAARRPGHRGR